MKYVATMKKRLMETWIFSTGGVGGIEKKNLALGRVKQP